MSSYSSRSSSAHSHYERKVQKKVKIEPKGDKSKDGEQKVETKVKTVETKVKKVEKKVEKGVEIKVQTKVEKTVEKKVETKVGKKPEKKAEKDKRIENKAEKKPDKKVESKVEKKAENKQEKKPDKKAAEKKLENKAEKKEEKKAEKADGAAETAIDKKAEQASQVEAGGSVDAPAGEAKHPGSPAVKDPGSPAVNGADSPTAQLLPAVKDLVQDSGSLQLLIRQAKLDLADRRETQQRQERREKEYFRPSFGDPVGPNNRLLLEEELGQGAFSTVFRARDLQAKQEDRHYAVKFIRKNPTLRTAMEREVKLMRRLRLEASEKDPEGASCFLGLAGPEVFDHEGHLALCFQLQKCDLRCGLKRYGQGGGLPLPTVRSYARNIFMALRALKAVDVIHSDVKPDNLLMSLDKVSVKLSDFGCAMNSSELIKPEKAAETVQPRYYRAPEVILGQEYSTQVDVWGAGCTVFELASGNFLFTGRNNSEMLHDMMKHLGAFSRRFCGAGLLSSKHFRREDGAFCLGGEQFVGRENFPRPARPLCDRLQETLTDASPVALKAFADLIVSCVTPDPAVRLDPAAALASTFLRPNTK